MASVETRTAPVHSSPGETAAREALARGSVYGGPRGHRPGGPLVSPASPGRKFAGLAAVLSFLLCGAGQWYCGRSRRGFAFLAGAALSALLCVVLVGFVLLPLVSLWAIVDAAKLANRRNGELAARLSGL